MGLRVEEYLGMAHIVGRRALEIGEGQILEVPARQEDVGPGVVDVEEVLQVGEVIGRAHRFDAVERNGHAVALRQFEHQLGFEAALDMEVQFRLGQAGDIGVKGHGRLRKRAFSLAYIRSGVSIPSRVRAVSS